MNIIEMIIVSVLAGFLSSMNVWVADWRDARSHINDVYMVSLMTGWMLLLSFIWHYRHSTHATLGVSISVIIILIFLFCVRTQFGVDDWQFLNGMIPHHSMAILMSEKIKDKTRDPRVYHLADHIMKTQREEIKLMNDILRSKG